MEKKQPAALVTTCFHGRKREKRGEGTGCSAAEDLHTAEGGDMKWEQQRLRSGAKGISNDFFRM